MNFINTMITYKIINDYELNLIYTIEFYENNIDIYKLTLWKSSINGDCSLTMILNDNDLDKNINNIEKTINYIITFLGKYEQSKLLIRLDYLNRTYFSIVFTITNNEFLLKLC